jgi:8-oxo-dGTP diphosphatase
MEHASDRDAIVTAILIRSGRVVLCHRSADRRWFPGVWDLPGGHIEPGEAPGAAVAREVKEELGVWIEPPHAGPRAGLSTAAFEMQIWVVSDWSGEIINAAPWEHDQVAWFLPGELDALDLAHEGYAGLIDDALADRRAAGLESPAAESGQ